MFAKEAKVLPESDYYLYHPSTVASQIYLYVKEIGFFYYEPGYRRSRIRYDNFLLMYISKGTCRLKIPGQPWQLAQTGQFILIDCYVPHEYVFDSCAEVLWMHFDEVLARSYYDLILASHGSIITPANIFPVCQAFTSLLTLFRNSGALSESSLSQTITGILDLLLQEPGYSVNTYSHSKIIDSSRAYINEHFKDPLTLEQLAGLANMSPFHFSRVFTRYTGFTPHQYLIATRINSAKFLLKCPDIPIKEIAFTSGFNSESSFCSTFRKWEHMTPSEYREHTFLSAPSEKN